MQKKPGQMRFLRLPAIFRHMTALCEETGFYQKVRTTKAAAEEAMDLADFLM